MAQTLGMSPSSGNRLASSNMTRSINRSSGDAGRRQESTGDGQHSSYNRFKNESLLYFHTNPNFKYSLHFYFFRPPSNDGRTRRWSTGPTFPLKDFHPCPQTPGTSRQQWFNGQPVMSNGNSEQLRHAGEPEMSNFYSRPPGIFGQAKGFHTGGRGVADNLNRVGERKRWSYGFEQQQDGNWGVGCKDIWQQQPFSGNSHFGPPGWQGSWQERHDNWHGGSLVGSSMASQGQSRGFQGAPIGGQGTSEVGGQQDWQNLPRQPKLPVHPRSNWLKVNAGANSEEGCSSVERDTYRSRPNEDGRCMEERQCSETQEEVETLIQDGDRLSDGQFDKVIYT